MRVAIIGGNGKTGRSVAAALDKRGVEPTLIGRAEWSDLVAAVRGSDAAYIVVPNMHPDEPAYVTSALRALAEAGVMRVVYHSVASPYLPEMPHHMGKAASENLVRRSGLEWTILQPGAYSQNFDLTAALRVPYDVDVLFGFADINEVGEAAAVVLTEDGHFGATYELASRLASVRQLAADAGVEVTQVPNQAEGSLAAMFNYYQRNGLPVGTRVLSMLLGRAGP